MPKEKILIIDNVFAPSKKDRILNGVQKFSKAQREVFELTGMNRDLIQTIKDGTITKISELAKYNENTQAAYDVLFGRLLDD